MAVVVDPFLALYDNFGNPLSGGRVYTYAAGTTTPLASYTDQSGLTPNTNPVILDSAGRANIWLTPAVAYKLVLKTAADVTIRTTDNFYAGAAPEQLVAAGIVPATGGNYTGLVDFQGGLTFSGTAAQDLATLDSLNIAGVQTSNLWINTDCAINQRAAASTADNTYGFDRIVNLCESGNVTLSQLAQPTDGIPYALRQLQPDASPKRLGSAQIIEARNCLSYRGKQLVFAFMARCSASTTIRCALVAWTSTADSPTRDPINTWASTTYTAGNFFVANTSTIAVSATAVTAGTWTELVVSSTSAGGVVAPSTLNNLYLVYWTDTAVAQNVTLDVSLLRAARGTVAPLWTPPDAQQELAKSQRYYQTGAVAFEGAGYATGPMRVTAYLPVSMRVAPTIAGTIALTNATTGTTDQVTTQSFRLNAVVTGAANAAMQINPFTASAEVGV